MFRIKKPKLLYELTLLDMIILIFKNDINSIEYLFPKVCKNSDRYYEYYKIKKPFNYYQYNYYQTAKILSDYIN